MNSHVRFAYLISLAFCSDSFVDIIYNGILISFLYVNILESRKDGVCTMESNQTTTFNIEIESWVVKLYVGQHSGAMSFPVIAK